MKPLQRRHSQVERREDLQSSSRNAERSLILRGIGSDEEDVFIRILASVDDAVLDHQFIGRVGLVPIHDAVVAVAVGVSPVAADEHTFVPVDAVFRLIQYKGAAVATVASTSSVEVIDTVEVGQFGVANLLGDVGPLLPAPGLCLSARR